MQDCAAKDAGLMAGLQDCAAKDTRGQVCAAKEIDRVGALCPGCLAGIRV